MAAFSWFLFVRGVVTILTNVAILPAVVLTWRRREYDGAFILFQLFAGSSLYHFCQSEFWCLLSFDTLRMVDYLCVYAAVAWTFLFASRVGPRWRAALVIVIVVQLMALQMQLGTRWYAALLALLVIGVPVLFCFAAIEAGASAPMPPRDLGALTAAVVLAASGFVFFFVEGEPDESDSYPFTHGAWHVFAMLSLLALIFSALPVPLNKERLRAFIDV